MSVSQTSVAQMVCRPNDRKPAQVDQRQHGRLLPTDQQVDV